MPTFCRHNRLLQNCPICSREQQVEMRPVLSPGVSRSSQPSERGSSYSSASSRTAARSTSRQSVSRSSGGLRVRRLAREADDGYRSGLVPGLKSGAEAQRLAQELAFASARLRMLATAPRGLYAQVADPGGDLEERTWLAFVIAYLGPLDGEQPFASIEHARTSWSSGRPLDLEDATFGPRGADPASGGGAVVGARTVDAYRAWAARAGSQGAAFTGEPAWTPQRRFTRIFERLALPGFARDQRFELLSALGWLGVYELQAGALAFGGSDLVTTGAKRVLGIGDPMLLERRAADLAHACQLPLEALDVGLYNWERGSRATLGMGLESEPDLVALEAARSALGL